MMNSDKPLRPDPGTDADEAGPTSGTAQPPPPTRERSSRRTPDKEGGAPVDELDLDGDGSRRQ